MRGRPTSEDKMVENLIKESKDSTVSSLALLQDSKKIGQASLKHLESQGRQFKHIQAGLDQVIEEEASSKKKIRIIDSIFGSLINKLAAIFSRKTRNKVDPSYPACKHLSTTIMNTEMKNQSAPMNSFNKRDEENIKHTDKNLDAMLGVVKDLDGIANKMQSELSVQNQQLDTLSGTTFTANINVSDLNYRMRKLNS
jgi:hypothetical protein